MATIMTNDEGDEDGHCSFLVQSALSQREMGKKERPSVETGVGFDRGGGQERTERVREADRGGQQLANPLFVHFP
ncbi:uncharacterized protein SPSK_10149 [Sporothrix schenckii 1099-18]|uniref:Uncharacterized protein n=1 Tax=Sporothrix schenckii 1099-18 TaxID=1397361 RepID=A0A0F2M8G4_SPOSC|nr:uncharacterized protein SPSK_10149 [Sporothrix schenckii 1099-18]KJR85973.1 hypothetical protein SPSK_10149 [Sporothrix schenckii 1099-18]